MENDTVNLVGSPSKPALLYVAQNGLELRLGTGNVRNLRDGHVQATPKESTKMRRRVRELIRLPVPLVKSNKDAHVMLARGHLDRGTRKFGRDLVEASGRESPLGAADVESADGGVVGGLLGQVGYPDQVFGARLEWVLRDGEGDGRDILGRTGAGAGLARFYT